MSKTYAQIFPMPPHLPQLKAKVMTKAYRFLAPHPLSDTTSDLLPVLILLQARWPHCVLRSCQASVHLQSTAHAVPSVRGCSSIYHDSSFHFHWTSAQFYKKRLLWSSTYGQMYAHLFFHHFFSYCTSLLFSNSMHHHRTHVYILFLSLQQCRAHSKYSVNLCSISPSINNKCNIAE